MKRKRDNDYAKNIKINININVNNNTNDVKITSFERGNSKNTSELESERIDSEDSMSCIQDTKDDLITLIKGLLFYKIEMPSGSSNRSILSSLSEIESKLNSLKNCDTYLVYNS